MTTRIDHAVSAGTFSLDGETFEVDNNIWVIGDDHECVVIDAPHNVADIMAVGVVDRLEAVEIEKDQCRRRVVPFSQRQRLGHFAHEGAAVQHRQHGIVIGERFQFAHTGAQTLGFLAQLVDLAHQGQEGALDVGRQFRFRHAHDRCGIARRGRGGRGGRAGRRRGAFGFACGAGAAGLIEPSDAHDLSFPENAGAIGSMLAGRG